MQVESFGVEFLQGETQFRSSFCFGAHLRFASQKELMAGLFDPGTHQFLGFAVAGGNVDMVDPGIEDVLHGPVGHGGGACIKGCRPENSNGTHMPGTAKSAFFHLNSFL
jgi:hypothetical protein